MGSFVVSGRLLNGTGTARPDPQTCKSPRPIAGALAPYTRSLTEDHIHDEGYDDPE